ncbi:MAG: hypothetical protein HC835_05410 [Oscillatoriales cyanobacterium RM2_1_1]|nr:hypothetical protein [Oscillatoriales cyanobacterium SM2_3_0]NJO45101.1 hypothetical protein [Oscillatoriales cyanobacterium RM2_1_1]
MTLSQDPLNSPEPTSQTAELTNLLQLLRRKEATWVAWGQACATLQKAGHSTQQIFEDTGFEPVQQNQVIVASQVYISLVNGDAPDAVRSHFQQQGSDILYELRILNQTERVTAAELVLNKNLDADEARDLAKAIKEFSRLPHLPEGFSHHPGDAVAYQTWRLARQQRDLQERSRLIARGLKVVHSAAARQQLEQLLMDFTVVSQRSAPQLPVYRVEAEEQLPRLIPVVGEFPLTVEDLKAVPLTEEIEPFRMVKFSGTGAWVPLPGWRVVLAAEDPVAFLIPGDRLPNLPGNSEIVLVMVDRAQRQWDADSYFLAETVVHGQLEVQWFEQAPDIKLYGRVVLLLRPKKIFDEDQIMEMLQFED